MKTIQDSMKAQIKKIKTITKIINKKKLVKMMNIMTLKKQKMIDVMKMMNIMTLKKKKKIVKKMNIMTLKKK